MSWCRRCLRCGHIFVIYVFTAVITYSNFGLTHRPKAHQSLARMRWECVRECLCVSVTVLLKIIIGAIRTGQFHLVFASAFGRCPFGTSLIGNVLTHSR